MVERGIIQLPLLRIGGGLLPRRMGVSQVEEECGDEDKIEVGAGGGVEGGRRGTWVDNRTYPLWRLSQHPHRRSRYR